MHFFFFLYKILNVLFAMQQIKNKLCILKKILFIYFVILNRDLWWGNSQLYDIDYVHFFDFF